MLSLCERLGRFHQNKNWKIGVTSRFYYKHIERTSTFYINYLVNKIVGDPPKLAKATEPTGFFSQ